MMNSTLGRTLLPVTNAELVKTSESSATAGGGAPNTATRPASVQRKRVIEVFMMTFSSNYFAGDCVGVRTWTTSRDNSSAPARCMTTRLAS